MENIELNKKNWNVPQLADLELHLYEQCMFLLYERAKTYRPYLDKQTIEKGVGYIDYGSLNYLLDKLDFDVEKKLGVPNQRCKIKLKYGIYQLLREYFKITLVPPDDLPQYWFRILYIDYLLNSHTESIEDFLKRVTNKNNGFKSRLAKDPKFVNSIRYIVDTKEYEEKKVNNFLVGEL